MTTPSSAFSQGARDNFDAGPLSWVMGEIRESLNRSKSAIGEAATQDVDARSTSIRHAKSYLHQAHGALQIVDVDGVAIITETVEDLLERIETGQLVLTAELVQSIGAGYQALVEYLDELLSGAPHQPVRLFPYYRTLLEARGAERIHPADLFFPNLAIRPQFPAREKAPDVQPTHYVALRKRFEMALLPFLKNNERRAELANAAVMREVVAEVESVQGNQQARAFWWVMHGLAEAVAGDQIDNEIYVKQLFARINLQLRRLCQGSSSIAERLLRDALFFIAKIKEPSQRAREIRKAYQLDGLVPPDYDRMRYGQVDVDALAAAKERLSQAKNIWNRIAGGDLSGADSFEHEMHMLADAGAKLGSAPLSKLLRELKGIARHAAHARPGELLNMEMATSLLFVESALSHIGRLSDDFAQRADALTARLLAVVTGEKPAESSEWLDDMSREAQQRQTMAAVAGEMQSSLRQVEKMLDEYFRDPSQRDALGQLDSVLHQIEGALNVLDQGDAVSTIQHTRAEVQRFLASEGENPPAEQDFQKVAQNIGALGFFIESLQLPAENVSKRFSFDEDRGLLNVNLVERGALGQSHDEQPMVATDLDGLTPAAADDAGEHTLSTVEEELARQQQQSAELAMSLSQQPDDPLLQERLKESLEQIRLDAALIDNPEATDRAQAGINILEQGDLSASSEALAGIMTAAVPAVAPQPLVAPAPAPESEEEIDAELLEIFLTEAEEVLGAIGQTLPESRDYPHNQEHLTTLRRSFHTLKGSGRMVGLSAFGEAAWSIEQVLNLRLSEGRSGDSELYALLEKAAEVLGEWVQEIKQQGWSKRSPQALVDAAERVKAGGPYLYEDDEDEAPVDPQGGVDSGTIEAAVASEQSGASNQPMLEEEPQAAAHEHDPVSAPVENALEPEQEGEQFADPQSIELLINDQAPDGFHQPEPSDLQDNAEADADFALDDGAAQDVVPTVASEHGAATNANIPRARGEVIEFPPLRETEARHNDNVKRIGELEISVPLHNIYLAETDELVRLLAQDFAEWRHEPERSVTLQSVHAAHSLAGSSATVGFASLQELAHALEMVLQFLLRKPVRLTAYDFDTFEHSVESMKLMLQKFALGEMPDHEPERVRLLHSLQRDIESRAEGQADTGQLDTVSDAEFPFAETGTDDTNGLMLSETVPAGELSDDMLPAQAPAQAVESELRPEAQPESVPDTEPALSEDPAVAPLATPAFVREPEASTDPALIVKDELDADLLPVFLEEGRDMLPQIGPVLRAWQEQPTDVAQPQSLLRLLHTLKGSARMAGAMALGQHLHDTETRVENIMHLGTPEPLAIEDLLVRYDQVLQMFEALQNPQATGPAQPTQPTPLPASGEAPGLEGVRAAEPGAHPVVLQQLMPLQSAAARSNVAPRGAQTLAASLPSQLVRVRADILDRLVNQAGEVSISRSRLETEVDTLKQSLSELTENVTRLRDQLREIEMQAETQITSRMSQSADREFDPLEFDRFTRLQELTRMMAESVNDVGSVQQNLSRTLESAVGDLSVQGRLTRDLQQDLMRVRMVQFASISERLFRVARQTAKETDKRVNLDIRGSAVELDRGVLEKMAGPFEHLLRNAIVHGIESREVRRTAGKDEIGQLLVDVRQEGNEVVIQFSDDGRGLNLDLIRDKARHAGLLSGDNEPSGQPELSDEEVTDLIFHPGFSTAEEITELAGRGVGMDVVRSEAAALGGRVSTETESGKGAHFTIRLPLTLAVTQVVLLSTGGQTYAVPSVLVEQVQQLKTNALVSAYNDGAVVWQGQRVPMYYLSSLLGDTSSSPVSQQYSPLLILRSGNERVALHVDQIIGNREVVVKNIGPQLSRMVGIAGATVLGSGDIVLILNPVPLAQRQSQQEGRAPRVEQTKLPAHMGAVAEIGARERAAPVQGLRTQSIVMVVDDSLTVRRVTQRLLTREGYQVVLAKDGVDALEHLQAVTPDAMLVDIEMPRMDGFDLTRNVRGDERTRHIPIIMITSRTASKHRNYALELGVDEYLGKPYQEEQLLSLLSGFIKKEVTST